MVWISKPVEVENFAKTNPLRAACSPGPTPSLHAMLPHSPAESSPTLTEERMNAPSYFKRQAIATSRRRLSPRLDVKIASRGGCSAIPPA